MAEAATTFSSSQASASHDSMMSTEAKIATTEFAPRATVTLFQWIGIEFMYESFFGVNRRPFTITPDSRCFAKIASAKTAFDSLFECLMNGEGVGIVTGAAGSGKTILCSALADETDRRFQTAFLSGERYSSYARFLEAVLEELDEPISSDDVYALQRQLKKYVSRTHRTQAGIVLIIDEAQSLEKKLCEGLRAISNWHAEGEPLVRMLLSGNWDLEEMLVSPEFEFLNERVGAHVILESFSKQETSAYIDFRLRHCGGSTFEIFTNETLDAIGQISEGVPRVVNLLCERSMLLAFENEEKPVTLETVQKAVGKVKHLPVHLNELSNDERIDDTETASAVDFGPLAVETDSDESERFVFEVGEPHASATISEPDDRVNEISSDDETEEAAVFETENSEDSHFKREWETANDILDESNEDDRIESIESEICEDDPIENVPISIAENSGDILEEEADPFIVFPEDEIELEIENEIPVLDDVATTNEDVKLSSSWKKVPIDLRWSNSVTTTLSPSDSMPPRTIGKQSDIRVESPIDVTSSQKYARIRPEQLLETLVSAGLVENQEKIESDSSWLRHNDTKIFDCVSSEPISFRDNTYERMREDYENSLELVEEVSSVASTSCESDVAHSLLSLLLEVEKKFSDDASVPTATATDVASFETKSETNALPDSSRRIGDSSDEMYDTVLPETSFEERRISAQPQFESLFSQDYELPNDAGTDASRFLLSDLFRRDAR